MANNRTAGRFGAGAGVLLCVLIGLWLGRSLVGLRLDSTRVYAAAVVDREPALNHPDAACRGCHQQIYDRYEKTPMARGSGPASSGFGADEMTAKGFMHEASGVSYLLSQEDGRLYLSYSRPKSADKPALNGREHLLYYVGSGRRGTTYLYERDGLWFETPINWYGKKKIWDMAPAFAESESMPGPLPVDANCLHCHAGEVQNASGGVRNRFAGTPFHAGGVGCAACHGDASAHLAHPTAKGLIVNQDKLTPLRRDQVCIQCHLEGDAVVYRPGKSLAGFKPGDDLFASAVYFVDRTKAQDGGRASSQYEALLRSACKRGAGDKLTCTTCHDAHGSPSATERVAYFRAKCLNCHTGAAMATQHHPEQPDCASCHMPTRKTLDISHEQMTDHDVEKIPVTMALRTRRKTPELVPVGAAKITIREEGLAYAQVAQHGDRAVADMAVQLLLAARRGGADDVEVHNQLGFLLQKRGLPVPAAAEYLAALKMQPQDTTAAANLAVLDASQGQVAEAIRLLQQVVMADPSQTAAGLNLALLECRQGRKIEALNVLNRMLRFNPDSVMAHRFLDTGVYGGETCLLR